MTEGIEFDENFCELCWSKTEKEKLLSCKTCSNLCCSDCNENNKCKECKNKSSFNK